MSIKPIAASLENATQGLSSSLQENDTSRRSIRAMRGSGDTLVMILSQAEPYIGAMTDQLDGVQRHTASVAEKLTSSKATIEQATNGSENDNRTAALAGIAHALGVLAGEGGVTALTAAHYEDLGLVASGLQQAITAAERLITNSYVTGEQLDDASGTITRTAAATRNYSRTLTGGAS